MDPSRLHPSFVSTIGSFRDDAVPLPNRCNTRSISVFYCHTNTAPTKSVGICDTDNNDSNNYNDSGNENDTIAVTITANATAY